VVVSSGASSKGPGSSSEAANLATTYAGLIPKDSSILAYVSGRTGRTVDEVRSSIAVVTDAGTSILDIEYTGSTSQMAIAGDQETALAIAGANPVSSAIPAGSVSLASLPHHAAKTAGTKDLAIPVGLLAGLALGIAVALIWERVDPRIDDGEDLQSVLTAPVTRTLGLSPSGSFALVKRWTQLSEKLDPEVGLVMLGSGQVRLGDEIGTWLLNEARLFASTNRPRDTGEQSGQYRSGAGSPTLLNCRVRAFGVPGGVETGHLAAIDSDVVVLLIVIGMPAKTVTDAVKVLTEFGHPPDWALLLDKGSVPRVRDSATGDRRGQAPSVRSRLTRTRPGVEARPRQFNRTRVGRSG
jgi:hypothetical protein